MTSLTDLHLCFIHHWVLLWGIPHSLTLSSLQFCFIQTDDPHDVWHAFRLQSIPVRFTPTFMATLPKIFSPIHQLSVHLTLHSQGHYNHLQSSFVFTANSRCSDTATKAVGGVFTRGLQHCFQCKSGLCCLCVRLWSSPVLATSLISCAWQG